MSADTEKEQCRGTADPVERVRVIYILAYRDFREGKTGHPCDYGCKPIPVWDGGRTARVGNRRPIWYALSELAGRYGFSPETLVHAAFAHFLDYDAQDPPDPPDLMTPGAIERAERFVTEGRRDAGRALDLQNDTFVTQVTVRRALSKETLEQAGIRVLNDSLIELSALYRFCVAHRCSVTDVAGRFAEPGMRQYLQRRDAYDSAWAGVLPPGMPAAVEDYYDRRAGW